MYTVTFYSFKGGVGRTMALVNVAVHLARNGQRVLVVDFDLEAPSFDSLPFSTRDRPGRRQTPGIVDYLSRYLADGVVPVVTDYVSEVRDAGSNGGRLWVMPAGRADGEYAERLAAIDWRTLYESQDGYVLLEELKAQWQSSYDPDYVLIDSRTGFTDVGGICTRQLPEAVVAMFFPNRQNLRGMESIVEAIRGEAEGPRKKAIDLHFVAANVPNLDDEEEILATRLREFRRALGMKSSPLLIHHYDSLTVLTQAVFTQDRIRTRLAREYRRLAAAIRQRNPADVGGALQWLDHAWDSVWNKNSAEDPDAVERRLELTRQRHADNGQVLTAIARVRLRQGRVDEARTLLEEALSLRHTRSRVYLFLADARQRLGDLQGAIEAAREVFQRPDAAVPDLLRAIHLLRLIDAGTLQGVATTPAVSALLAQDALQLASALSQSRNELLEARIIFERAIRQAEANVYDAHEDETMALLKSGLSLVLIGLAEFQGAVDALTKGFPRAYFGLADEFNLAVAQWGARGSPDLDSFHSVHLWFERDTQDLGRDPNYYQCRALTSLVLNDPASAAADIGEARRLNTKRAAPTFSCWRYLRVRPNIFSQDLDAMSLWAQGGYAPPVVFRPAEATADVDGAAKQNA